MKVEVAVLGSPSLISPYGLCGRKATLNLNFVYRNFSSGVVIFAARTPLTSRRQQE